MDKKDILKKYEDIIFDLDKVFCLENVKLCHRLLYEIFKRENIITKINNDAVENSSYFKYKLYSYKVGETVKITVKRNNKEITLKVKLESGSRKKA